MNRLIGRYLPLLLMAPMWFSASAATYFNALPSSAKFPAGMTTENANGVLPLEHGYKHGFTLEGWTIETVGTSGYSFVSPSYSGTESPQDSRLTTPAFTVDNATAWLRWEAKSVLPGFPEDYDVIVAEADGASSAIIAHIDAEASEWQTRLVSLEEFAGKEVCVSFVCRSVNKYMLAVKNIFAGEFDKPEWIARDTTPRYASVSEKAAATGTLTNIGAPAEGIKIVCRIGDEELTEEISGIWAPSESFSYNFELPLSLNEATSYTIGTQDAEGNFSPVVSSDVFASHFVRNLVVDEGTGMWCNNCPEGILELDKLKREFADNIIILSCHANDLFAMDDYWSHLKFYAVPYMMLNRHHDTAGSSSKNFSKQYYSPTLAEITFPAKASADNGSFKITVTARFAENIDNSNDNYRIAYTVTADIFSPTNLDYYQQNNLTFNRGEQYYMLPALIPSTLARFDNVVVSEEYAFTGIEGSLPSAIEAMEEYAATIKIELPPLAQEAEKVNVVAYVVDTTNGNILNATSADVTTTNGVESIFAETPGNKPSVAVTREGKCVVKGIADGETFHITVIDAAGRMFDSRTTTRQALEAAPVIIPEGLAIIKIATSHGNAVAKIIRK